MAEQSFKAPPVLNKDITYNSWKKELQIWQAFTTINKKKQAPGIFLTLSGQAREAVSELPIEQLTDDDGVDNLLTALDALYLKDETLLAYEAFETFEKFIRPQDMSITDYIITFERLYHKSKSYKMEIQDGVLAYRLLNSANLSETNKQLVKATLDTMSYKAMKDKLKKVFTSNNISTHTSTSSVKIESTNSSDHDQVFYSRGHYQHRGGQRRGYGRANGRASYNFNNNRRQTNPRDENGEISRCVICESIFHWANKCPHSHETLRQKSNDKSNGVKNL